MESYDWLFGDNQVEEFKEEPKTISDEPIWKTKEGKEIPVSQMSTKHVVYCLRCCIKWNKRKWKTIFENEIKRRSSPLKRDFSL